eukprot:gene40838-49809_t
MGHQEGRDVYLINDYSKNGTYLNNELVGANGPKEISDGDVIVLRYKERDRIIYRFSPSPITPSPPVALPSTPTPLTASKSDRTHGVEVQESPSRARCDMTTEVLTSQLSSLQKEVAALEQKQVQMQQVIETQQADLDKANRKSRQDDATLARYEKEIADLRERLQVSEAHCAAAQARNVILEDQASVSAEQLASFKLKLHQMAEDLQEKTRALEQKREQLEESIRALACEHQLRTQTEDTAKELKDTVSSLQVEVEQLKTESGQLQRTVASQNAEIHRLERNLSVYESLRGQLSLSMDDCKQRILTQRLQLAQLLRGMQEVCGGLEGVGGEVISWGEMVKGVNTGLLMNMEKSYKEIEVGNGSPIIRSTPSITQASGGGGNAQHLKGNAWPGTGRGGLTQGAGDVEGRVEDGGGEFTQCFRYDLPYTQVPLSPPSPPKAHAYTHPPTSSYQVHEREDLLTSQDFPPSTLPSAPPSDGKN